MLSISKPSRTVACTHLALLAMMTLGAVRSYGIDASEVLGQALERERRLPPMSMELEVWQRYSHEPYGRRFLNSFRKRGEEIDVISDSAMWDDNGDIRPMVETREIWDGQKMFGRTFRGTKKSGFIMRQKPVVAWRTHAPFIFGVLTYGDTVHFAEMLRGSPSCTLRSQKEAIDGHPCYVIDADMADCHYTLWLDPDAGLLCRKADVKKVHRKPIPLEGGKTLAAQVFHLKDVTIEVTSGIPSIMRATQIVDNTHGDGSTLTDKHTAIVKSVSWNPDFARMGAFVIDLPDGSSVAENDKAIKYIWKDGELKPKLNASVIDSIKTTAAALPIEAQTAGWGPWVRISAVIGVLVAVSTALVLRARRKGAAHA